MGIVLFRVDERLIHGQVVVGWGNHLRSRLYVVFDDELAESGWEQDLYRLALPSSAEARFHRLSEARRVLAALRDDPARSVVLFRCLAAATAVEPGAWDEGDVLNLGGLHHKPGARSVRTYLHLDGADEEAIRTLAARGVRVFGRDLPSSSLVPEGELLER